MSDFLLLEQKVIEWARDRDILDNAKMEIQLIKTLEELGETAQAFLKNHPQEYVDGIGDVCVTLLIANQLQAVPTVLDEDTFLVSDSTDPIENFGFIAGTVGCILGLGRKSFFCGDLEVCLRALEGLAALEGITLVEALETAYNEIKDRKGKLLPSGVFLKEADVQGD